MEQDTRANASANTPIRAEGRYKLVCESTNTVLRHDIKGKGAALAALAELFDEGRKLVSVMPEHWERRWVDPAIVTASRDELPWPIVLGGRVKLTVDVECEPCGGPDDGGLAIRAYLSADDDNCADRWVREIPVAVAEELLAQHAMAEYGAEVSDANTTSRAWIEQRVSSRLLALLRAGGELR